MSRNPTARKTGTTKIVETLKHDEATRKNIPTAEFQSVFQRNEQDPVRIADERRNRDLDPQLVWRGTRDSPRGRTRQIPHAMNRLLAFPLLPLLQ